MNQLVTSIPEVANVTGGYEYLSGFIVIIVWIVDKNVGASRTDKNGTS